jgi:hypothetical protein
MRSVRFSFALVVLQLHGVACGDKPDDTGLAEGDVDTDVDADTDADSDADADSDSDADADSDTDTDPNAPPTLDSTADAVLVGENDGDWFGDALSGSGDIDGDGYDDVLITAPGTASWGTAYVFLGPAYGELSADSSDAIIDYGGGYSLDSDNCIIVEDSNGDGFDDIVLGMTPDDPVAGLFLGPLTGSLGIDDADALVDWSGGKDLLATVAGDLDGGGTDELVLDAVDEIFVMTMPLEGTVNPGSEASAILSPPWPTEMHPCWLDHHWEIEYEREGTSAAIGDLDGDGFGELIVTNTQWNDQWWEKDPWDACESSKGIAYVVQGPVTGDIDLATSSTILDGEDDIVQDYLGGDSGPMGDTDGDGYADFFVAGGVRDTVFVVLGPLTGGGEISALPNVASIIPGEYTPHHDTHGAGDIDGDGLGDLVMGLADLEADWIYGAAVLLAPFSGTIEVDDANHLFRGVERSDQAGDSVSSGDFDADGLMDLLIGARSAQVDGEYLGKAYLHYGADL